MRRKTGKGKGFINYPVAEDGAGSMVLENWRISKKVEGKLLQRLQALFGGDKLSVATLLCVLQL